MMKFTDSILHNFLPKILALVLAVATWFYVFDLVNSDSQRKETIADILSRTNFIVKEVPVKPVFIGKTPAGFKTVFDDIKVKPASVAIFGPEIIVSKVVELKTDRIDLAEYTRSVTLRLSVHSNVKSLQLDGKVVEVILPVFPVKEDKPIKIVEEGKKEVKGSIPEATGKV